MEQLYTSAETTAIDRFAGDSLKMPAALLMENAGRGVADAIERAVGPVWAKSFIVVCGKGNNGGDGFVAARHLCIRGAVRILVLMLAPPGALSPLAKSNYEILKRTAASVPGVICAFRQIRDRKDLSSIPRYDILIDGLLGTGCHTDVTGKLREVIDWMNRRDEYTVAVDVPSGLDADSGRVCGGAVHADLTVTMCVKKVGLVIGKAPEYVGTVQIADIGFPPDLTRKKSEAMLVGHRDIHRLLPERPFDAHKHSVGKIFVLAGSRGLTGAAALSASAAMRSGAGAVVLGTAESVYPILAKKLTEVMVTPLWETAGGSVSPVAFDQMKTYFDWADIILVGPGLSRHDETSELIRTILRKIDKPMLVDADGLNAIAGDRSVLKKRKSRELILTPHAGEFSRLTGIEANTIELNRLVLAREFARDYSVTLVLKGAPTLTVSPSGTVVVNSTGNSGMATAGAGDILSGIISGLWGQQMKATDAAVAGVYIHGLAGDRAKESFGERGLMAADIGDYVPETIKRLAAVDDF